MSASVQTVNLTAAALVAQFFYLLIVSVGVLLLPPDTSINRPAVEIPHWPIVLFLAIFSLGPLIMSRDVWGLSTAVYGNVNLAIFNNSTAMEMMFGSDLFATFILISSTGGARESPFISALLVLPALAIFLHEPYLRVGIYVAACALACVTTAERRPMFGDDPVAGNLSFLFVTIASMVLATFISWVTRPR